MAIPCVGIIISWFANAYCGAVNWDPREPGQKHFLLHIQRESNPKRTQARNLKLALVLSL
jgi:hypothetical protein